jgi:quinol monooxygenase YgiN
MISVVTTVNVKKNKKLEFLEKFKEVLPKVKQELGHIEYFAAADIDSKIPIQDLNENVIMVLEKWESMKSLHNHLEAPHMQVFLKEVSNLVENVSIKVLQEI